MNGVVSINQLVLKAFQGQMNGPFQSVIDYTILLLMEKAGLVLMRVQMGVCIKYINHLD